MTVLVPPAPAELRMRTDALGNKIKACLAETGPLLGKELADRFPQEPHLALWQACYRDMDLQISHFAGYYLRYDVTRADQVRLSPSILRDFLSFTLVSLPDQRGRSIERQVALSNRHREISQRKIAIARGLVADLLDDIDPVLHGQLCAFIAGDNAYYLGHDEPREVKALGEVVRGSDIDIIIIHEDLDPALVEEMERKLLRAKTYYLRHPDHRQELDFIVKTRDRMFSQFQYSDIHEKIASKIAYESMFIGGAVRLYMDIAEGLTESGVKQLIEADFEVARRDRKGAMQTLLAADPDNLDRNTESLFFFSLERLEFQ